MGLKVADLFFTSRNGHSTNGTSHQNGTSNSSGQRLSLEEFAKAKGFSTDFLSRLGVHEQRNVLIFRYLTMDGQKANRQRIRQSLTGDRFRWSTSEGRPIPYLVWLLDAARKAGKREVVVCEGESDPLTFCAHDIVAIGIPGSEMSSTLAAPHIRGFNTIYICKEPDQGGESFEKGMIGGCRNSSSTARSPSSKWSGRA